MVKRIFATLLSILLAVSLLLSRTTTAKADSWQETFDRYDELFAVTDDLPENKFHTLYTVLQTEPGTFLNQLAFRDKDTKEYVLSILTGDWVSDESLRTMSALVSPMQFMQELTDSEKELSEDLQYHLNYTYHSRPRQHRDMETLFAQCMDVPIDGLERFSTEVKYAFMEDPHTFIVKLAQEELNVQHNILGDLLVHFEDTIPSLIVLDLLLLEQDTARKNPGYYTDEELSLIEIAIGNTILAADSHSLSAPYTHELSLWIRQQEKSDSWSSTIGQYDKLFHSGNYERLYTSLILDPDTFVNQLAFRDAETKENVMYFLTGPWITPEQMRNMTQMVESLRSTDLDKTMMETQLLNAMHEHFVCADFQYQGIVTDCEELIEWVKTADPAGAYDLSLELACALIGTPETFLLHLAREKKAVQDRVIELLQIHHATYLANAVINSISGSEAPNNLETASLVLEIYTSLGCKGTPVLSDPDPEEYDNWLTQAPLNPSIYVDYEFLFAVPNSKSLAIALLDDTRNFVKNLAYQDAETKQDVFDALTGTLFEDWQLLQMYLCLQQHKESTVLNKSQTALAEALMYHLDYAYCGRGQPYRDISVLFNTSPDEGNTTFRFYTFRRELKFAFLADPYGFLSQLEKKDENRRSYVIRGLMFTEDNSDALTRQVSTQWFREAVADYYTEEQYAMIQEYTANAAVFSEDPPKPSDPDPEEYEDWLANQKPIYGPGVPPLPTEATEATEATAPEGSQPADTDTAKKDTGWVSTVCFVLGFLCVGITTGCVIAKRKLAKAASQIPPPSPISVTPQPKLLYCPMPLSRETQQQITLALRAKYDEYSVHWYSIKQPDGTCRCYGTDNGYDIIFYAGGLRLEIPDSCTVGNVTFHFGTGFELYAHKDGQLIDLDTALAQGFVSLQAVQEAHKKHQSLAN